ncbi:MAG: HAMP domain-containing protein, partial [Chloroflexi bacterium]|nr:HAMP domain-containing protein [Chloroflexota bacterium]
MNERSEPKRSILSFLLSLPLRFKIAIPYLIVASLLAGLATYLVGRSFVSTLEDRFRSQLEDASIRVSEGVVDVEAAHLYMLRTIAFTMGVPDAVVDQDIDALRTLVFPHIVNDQLYFVDILGSDGAPLATWHRIEGTSEYRENETASYLEWPSVRAVLAGESDDMGDKYVDIIETPWGLAIYTVGPIRTEEGLQGILLIGTPVSKMIFELSKLGIANTTLYNSSGEALVSTLDVAALDSLDDELRSGLPDAEEALLAREVSINQRGYIEAVVDLSLRGQPSGWFLGVALPESLVSESQGPTTWQLITIFAVGILALIGLGVVVAQLIAGPVFRLLNASQQVGTGNLDVHVDVQAEDEIGQLTRGFNRMVVDLQQREFIREMFGRMVSEDVREAVLQNQVVLGGEMRDVTILFTDVRGFTSMSEKMSPEEVVALLNQFFNIVTTATHKHHGGVNHFGGDSVLAVFGAPIEHPLEETIQQAILAAIDIWRGVTELNAHRIQSGLFPIRFGIGINS